MKSQDVTLEASVEGFLGGQKHRLPVFTENFACLNEVHSTGPVLLSAPTGVATYLGSVTSIHVATIFGFDPECGSDLPPPLRPGNRKVLPRFLVGAVYLPGTARNPQSIPFRSCSEGNAEDCRGNLKPADSGRFLPVHSNSGSMQPPGYAAVPPLRQDEALSSHGSSYHGDNSNVYRLLHRSTPARDCICHDHVTAFVSPRLKIHPSFSFASHSSFRANTSS